MPMTKVNIASLRSALNGVGMAGLVARLEEIKLLPNRRLGLVWRLQAQEGQNFTKARPAQWSVPRSHRKCR